MIIALDLKSSSSSFPFKDFWVSNTMIKIYVVLQNFYKLFKISTKLFISFTAENEFSSFNFLAKQHIQLGWWGWFHLLCDIIILTSKSRCHINNKEHNQVT